MEYKHIIVETSENVGIITLNRGSVLNAVNEGMLSETAHQLGGRKKLLRQESTFLNCNKSKSRAALFWEIIINPLP